MWLFFNILIPCFELWTITHDRVSEEVPLETNAEGIWLPYIYSKTALVFLADTSHWGVMVKCVWWGGWGYRWGWWGYRSAVPNLGVLTPFAVWMIKMWRCKDALQCWLSMMNLLPVYKYVTLMLFIHTWQLQLQSKVLVCFRKLT